MTVAYVEGGVGYREQLFTAIEGFQHMGVGMWSNALTIAARAPRGEYARYGRVARVVVNSFALSPSWIEGEASGQQHRARVVEDVQRAVARIDREIAEHRSRTRAEIADRQYLTLTGQDRWRNPHTGSVELGSNEWKYRWQDSFGRVIYTDDDRWNPNMDPGLKVQGFERSPITR